MKIDAYFILILLSVIVVVSYFYNYLSAKLKIPSVLLLIATGIALQFATRAFGFTLPPTQTVLELLGITGLVFIVLEAALDLTLERSKFRLIWRAFGSALGLLTVTAGSIALIFVYYYGTTFQQALIYAIPLSIISSAIAIPSVSNMDMEARVFERLTEVSKEMKLMTAETAFIIRTFFFLLFGYSMNLELLRSQEVLVIGLAIIALTLVARFFFLRFVLKITSTPLALIAPRGLITVLLFYSIPPERRLDNISEGVLFIVIVLTSLMMTIGLLINKERPTERAEDLI